MHEDSVNLNRKDVEVQKLKKEVNHWSDKLKEQDHDLHTIKSEKNLFSKNLTEVKVCVFKTLSTTAVLLIQFAFRMKKTK